MFGDRLWLRNNVTQLARNDHKVTGIDISSDSIKHAKSFVKKYLHKKIKKKSNI